MRPARVFHPAMTVLLAFAAVWGTLLPAQPAEASLEPFAQDSVWTAPLARDAPVVPDSAAMVGELERQTLSGGTWIDTTEWSTPVYTVPRDQPRVRVYFDDTDPTLAADFADVPLPADARPASGSDGHLSLRQPGTDSLWEFWGLTRSVGAWHARWGGKLSHVSSNPGYFDYPYGATASGLPLIGGLIGIGELTAGRIDHAL